MIEVQKAKKNLHLLHEFADDSKNQSYINCMDWSADGKFIACGDIDGQSKIF